MSPHLVHLWKHCSPHHFLHLNVRQYAVKEGEAICSFNGVTVIHRVDIALLPGFKKLNSANSASGSNYSSPIDLHGDVAVPFCSWVS